jgi:hypothetical protein
LDFSPPRIEVGAETKRWIMVILLIVVGAVSILSLFDAAGTLGVYLNTFLKIVFGVSRWYLPLILIMAGYFLWRINKYDFKFSNVFGTNHFLFWAFTGWSMFFFIKVIYGRERTKLVWAAAMSAPVRSLGPD